MGEWGGNGHYEALQLMIRKSCQPFSARCLIEKTNLKIDFLLLRWKEDIEKAFYHKTLLINLQLI